MQSLPPTLIVSSLNLDSEETLVKKLSPKDLQERICAVSACQIELIGNEIIRKILSSLGAIRKFQILQQIKEKNHPIDKEIWKKAEMFAEFEKIASHPFLTDQQILRLYSSILRPIQKVINSAFSLPLSSAESRISFKLSKNHFIGIVKNTAQEIEIEMKSRHVPSNYCLYLELDQKLTSEKSTLVFNLIEESESVEFSRDSFTIQQLEADWGESEKSE